MHGRAETPSRPSPIQLAAVPNSAPACGRANRQLPVQLREASHERVPLHQQGVALRLLRRRWLHVGICTHGGRPPGEQGTPPAAPDGSCPDSRLLRALALHAGLPWRLLASQPSGRLRRCQEAGCDLVDLVEEDAGGRPGPAAGRTEQRVGERPRQRVDVGHQANAGLQAAVQALREHVPVDAPGAPFREDVVALLQQEARGGLEAELLRPAEDPEVLSGAASHSHDYLAALLDVLRDARNHPAVMVVALRLPPQLAPLEVKHRRVASQCPAVPVLEPGGGGINEEDDVPSSQGLDPARRRRCCGGRAVFRGMLGPDADDASSQPTVEGLPLPRLGDELVDEGDLVLEVLDGVPRLPLLRRLLPLHGLHLPL
mmetsp:Transcript_626/g.2017  ORF Transcript_626/g.2017 Transcript_626/m.2017 type:complete len:372 (-) Transcript_626:380-1495(-)